jgi:hypothetical protein
MATRIVSDGQLNEVAPTVAGLKVKKAVEGRTSMAHVQKRQQLKILDLVGSIDYDASDDYKTQRLRERGVCVLF